ncbi:MAG: methyltransferase domain-containing protein, partial [Myxococcales bacterium]|nr:methyltransferase domain-containing protein [Myxococcales bacterium]
DHLETSATVDELAERVGATPEGIRRLCRVLGTMGLLRMSGDRIEASVDALAALSRQGERSIADVLLHHRRQLAPLFAELTRAVRTGRAQHAAWPFVTGAPADGAYAELVRHPGELATFLTAMDHASAGVGRAMVPSLRQRYVRRLVDFGCGGGAVARELLVAMPELVIESYDLAPVAAIASERSRTAGLTGRHRISEGDIFAGIDARDADGVLLSAILADWSRAERAAILENARRILRPGGHVFISETLLDDDRAGPASAAMFSLVMLLAMRGDQLSFGELRAELSEAGFVEVTVQRGGPRDLVVARAR